MTVQIVSLLILVTIHATLQGGQYVIGPYWSNPHHQTPNIYNLCKRNGALCFTEPVDCIEAYPLKTSCQTIIALTNYLNGLKTANHDQYEQQLKRSPEVRNETLKGIFLFGKLDKNKHANQSVGVALGLDPALVKDPKIFYVCTKNNGSTNQVFGTMWTFNDKGVPYGNVLGPVQLKNTQPTDLEYYACVWGENMDYVNQPDNFYASIAHVEFNNFNDGKILRTVHI